MLRLACLFLCSMFVFSAENKGVPYVVYRPSPGAGFWSNFFSILYGLDKADKWGYAPVVDMERHRTFYNEEQPLFGTLNAWEYYFEQPKRLSLGEALKGPHIVVKKFGVFSRALTIRPHKDKVIRAKELIGKYIRIHQPILDDVDGYIAPGFHKEILGVHVRGTDRRQGTCISHALTAEASVYLEAALRLDKIYHFSKIFLACDEIESVEMFTAAFGERLICTDAYRVSASVETDRSHDWLYKGDRVNHRYLLGREVLIDALLLSRCGHLLCGPSNVSHAAIYFSAGEPMIHEVASPGISSST